MKNNAPSANIPLKANFELDQTAGTIPSADLPVSGQRAKPKRGLFSALRGFTKSSGAGADAAGAHESVARAASNSVGSSSQAMKERPAPTHAAKAAKPRNFREGALFRSGGKAAWNAPLSKNLTATLPRERGALPALAAAPHKTQGVPAPSAQAKSNASVQAEPGLPVDHVLIRQEPSESVGSDVSQLSIDSALHALNLKPAPTIQSSAESDSRGSDVDKALLKDVVSVIKGNDVLIELSKSEMADHVLLSAIAQVHEASGNGSKALSDLISRSLNPQTGLIHPEAKQGVSALLHFAKLNVHVSQV